MTDVYKFYEQIREKIVHEDELVNHRLMWAITLNGLLFTAYGFSLGAEGSSLAAATTDSGVSVAAASSAASAVGNMAKAAAYTSFMETIASLRHGMVLVGIGSSFAAFVGVVAAYRSIRDDEYHFTLFRNRDPDAPRFPLPIGRRSTNLLGMFSGLAVPFLLAGAWLWIGKLVPDLLFVAIGLASAALAGLALWPLMPRRHEPHDA